MAEIISLEEARKHRPLGKRTLLTKEEQDDRLRAVAARIDDDHVSHFRSWFSDEYKLLGRVSEDWEERYYTIGDQLAQSTPLRKNEMIDTAKLLRSLSKDIASVIRATNMFFSIHHADSLRPISDIIYSSGEEIMAINSSIARLLHHNEQLYESQQAEVRDWFFGYEKKHMAFGDTLSDFILEVQPKETVLKRNARRY